MLFEVIIGETIPTHIHSNKNILVYNGTVNGFQVQVLLDRHQFAGNLGVFNDAEEYADLCFYMTINYWMMDDINASEHWFRTGEALWNHTSDKGFYDKAIYDNNSVTYHRYQNYKLGLFLLAQRVTKFPSTITDEVEATAWSYQNNLGGITTQSWLNGSFYGTANAEATSALLISYNDQLVTRLTQKLSLAEFELIKAQETIKNLSNYPWALAVWPVWFTILLISTLSLAILCVALILWLIKRSYIRKEL